MGFEIKTQVFISLLKISYTTENETERMNKLDIYKLFNCFMKFNCCTHRNVRFGVVLYIFLLQIVIAILARYVSMDFV